jgi:TRAP-type transport system periplasmic protein
MGKRQNGGHLVEKTGRSRTFFALMAVMSVLVFVILQPGSAQGQSGKVEGGGKAYVLKTVTYFDDKSVWTNAFKIFKRTVEEKLKGQVLIQRVGGVETIPGFEMGAALKAGNIDIILLTASWLSSQFPEIEMLAKSSLKPWEERERGVYGFYDSLAASKLNAHYLGRTSGGVPNQVYTNFGVSKVEDFKGRLIRVTPLQRDAIAALEAKPVTIPPPELYTSMERKTVDGFCWPSLGVVELGMHAVTKYRIEPGFDQQEASLWVNLNAWNKLPSDIRKAIDEMMPQIEREAFAKDWEEYEKERKLQQEKGIKIVELSPGESERFVNTIKEGEWQALVKRFPESAPKLREMMSAKK